MRLSIIAALALLVVSANVATASAAPERSSSLTAREAALAVREEVGANWTLLETGRRGPGSEAATIEVDCMGITPRKRVCVWEGSNEERGVTAEGLATVRALPGGPSARLYAFRCEARGLACV